MTCCIFCSHQTELESVNKDWILAFFSTFPFCEASDVAISQFRFIVPLLFCHGALGLEVFWNPLTFEEIRDGGVFFEM